VPPAAANPGQSRAGVSSPHHPGDSFTTLGIHG